MQIVLEITVFLENRPGTVARIAGELAKRDINILGFNLINAHDYGALRLIVDDPKAAAHLLGEYNMFVLEHEILAVRLQNEVGALQRMSEALHESGVGIDYAYGSSDSTSTGATMMYLRVADPQKATEILKNVPGVL